ncbi:MAG: SusC/RagA family TonB-linked outer membrane protein [Marinifilaceae bacterium]
MRNNFKKSTYPRGRIGGYCLNFLLVLCFSIISHSAIAASEMQRLTLKYDAIMLKELLKTIERKTDLAFVYKAKDIEDCEIKKLDFTDAPIDEILNKCLGDNAMSYEITEKHVVIRKTEKAIPTTQAHIAKSRKIKGVVLDEKGSPLPGAAVLIPGTQLGVATNVDGEFELLVLETDGTIAVTYIGYQQALVQIKGKNTIKVVMEPESAAMEAVVVTGIFARKAESYSGAARTVTKEELMRVGNRNILQSLGTLDPSFQIIENNQYGSDPNRVPEIQMRGASSFSDMKDKYQTNPNQPLFIVDGFEQSIEKVLDMDMNRVESVTLLKDATAKALYGSKGANGVVVVETIKPKMGQLTVSYTGSVELEMPDLRSYNLCDAAQKLEVERLAGVYTASVNNPITQQGLDAQYAELFKEVQRGVNTYWLDKPLRTGIGTKHSLNFEGGDAYMRYQANVHYNKVTGVMKGSERENFGGEMMLSYRYKDVIFREQLILSHNKATNSPFGAFAEYAQLNPYWRAYDESGALNEILGYYSMPNMQGTRPIYNPMINSTLNTNDESKYTDITNNLYAEWKLTEALKTTGRLGITHRTSEGDVFYPRDHTKFRSETFDDEEFFKRGEYTKENGKMTNYSLDLGLNYNKALGKSLILFNGQWSLSQNKMERVVVQAQGFANNKLDYITHASQYMTNGKPSGSETMNRETSVLLSGNYSYDSRFMIDANYRGNASSLFGKDNRWGHFWSVGGGWNIHNEAFLKESGLFQQFKVRASTGYTGSQNFNAYQAMATYRYFSDELYDNIIGSYLLSLANPELKWQRTQDNNIGVDLSLFKRLDISFDYYVKKTDNLLTPVTLAPSVGFNSYTENLGKSENKGVEARVTYRIVSNGKRDVHANIFGSLMHNKNRIKEINDALRSMNDEKDSAHNNLNYNPDTKQETTKPSVRYKEGESMDAIWAVRSLGIDPGTGNELFLDKDGNVTRAWNAANQVVCGDAMPKASGTFGFNLDVKGFSVNTSFFYRVGGDVYNQTLVDKVEDADIQWNVDYRVRSGRWTTPGQEAQYKKLSNPNYFTRPTSRFVQRLNELQMTTLNVGYDFRNCRFIKNGKIDRLKISFYMNDLFKVSSVEIERGTDYPFARSSSFQVQLTF